MKNTKKINSQKGYVIVLALIAMMTMTFFLMTGAMTTTSTMKVSGNYTKTVDGFNLAEIALAKSRPILEANAFNDLLLDYAQADLPIISRTAFNKGFYEAWVYDNDDGDGDLAVDADDIIIINAIGINSAGGTVEIEAHIQKPNVVTPPTFPANPAGGPGAAMMCGTATNVKTQGSSEVWGHDKILPPSGCSGGGCEGFDCSDPSIRGTGTPDQEARCDAICGVGVVCTGSRAVVGEGAVSASGTFISNLSPAVKSYVPDTNCDEWRTLRDELASLDASSPYVEVLTGSGTTAILNDCTNPKVFIINTPSSSFKFSGSAEVCGTIVVASNTAVEATGNVVIAGTVLLMGETADLSFIAASGTPRFFGQVIVQSTSVDKALELQVKGNAQVNYSSEGIAFSEQAMQNALTGGGGGGGGGGLITMAWKETY